MRLPTHAEIQVKPSQKKGSQVMIWSNTATLPIFSKSFTLQWRHNESDCVSTHQRLDCLLDRIFRLRSKKTSKLRVTDLCAGNSPVTGEFPAQRTGNAENVSIWWRHHEKPHNSPRGVYMYTYIEFKASRCSTWCLLSAISSLDRVQTTYMVVHGGSTKYLI